MDYESAQRRMVGCDGDASQTSRRRSSLLWMRCWNSFIVRDVASRAGKARSSTGCVVSRDLEAIFMVCEKEVSRDHMHGYFSEEGLKSCFGTGRWRASLLCGTAES